MRLPLAAHARLADARALTRRARMGGSPCGLRSLRSLRPKRLRALGVFAPPAARGSRCSRWSQAASPALTPLAVRPGSSGFSFSRIYHNWHSHPGRSPHHAFDSVAAPRLPHPFGAGAGRQSISPPPVGSVGPRTAPECRQCASGCMLGPSAPAARGVKRCPHCGLCSFVACAPRFRASAAGSLVLARGSIGGRGGPRAKPPSRKGRRE